VDGKWKGSLKCIATDTYRLSLSTLRTAGLHAESTNIYLISTSRFVERHWNNVSIIIWPEKLDDIIVSCDVIIYYLHTLTSSVIMYLFAWNHSWYWIDWYQMLEMPSWLEIYCVVSNLRVQTSHTYHTTKIITRNISVQIGTIPVQYVTLGVEIWSLVSNLVWDRCEVYWTNTNT
jgi:hypothetical protein